MEKHQWPLGKSGEQRDPRQTKGKTEMTTITNEADALKADLFMTILIWTTLTYLCETGRNLK
jgi:hypothetical protein